MAGTEPATDAVERPYPWRPLLGICAVTVFGAIVFYTVPVEMSYLMDDLGVKNSGLIGLATAIASAGPRPPRVWTSSRSGHATRPRSTRWPSAWGGAACG